MMLKPNQEPGEPQLDVADILFEHRTKQGSTEDPEVFREALGEEVTIVGNVLINTEISLTRAELAELSGMSIEEVDNTYDILKELLEEGTSPLELTETFDRESEDFRYRIDASEPKQAEELNITPGKGSVRNPLNQLLDDIGKVPLLTATEEVELAKRYERGDMDAKQHMMDANLRLVVSIAKDYQGHGAGLLELIRDGSLGLVRAVEKFDYRKGNKLSTYATLWIRHAIQRGLPELIYPTSISQYKHEQIMRIKKSSHVLKDKLDREPTPEEISSEADVPIEEVEPLMQLAKTPASLNKPVGEDEDAELGDLLPAKIVDVEEEAISNVNRSHQKKVVGRALESLDERERAVLKLRYWSDGDEPKSAARVIKDLKKDFPHIQGVNSAGTVRQIEEGAIAKLLDESGVELRAVADASDDFEVIAA